MACTKLEIFSVDSICYYYDIFDTSQKDFLDINNELKEIPSEAGRCNSGQVFDLSKYSSLSESEKSMRATCYPVYNDVTSAEIPVSSANIPMLKVDYESWRIKWNERIEKDKNVLN